MMLKAKGIEVVVVTISQGSDLFELEKIASPSESETGVKLVVAGSYDKLKSIVGEVVAQAC